jgi:hypothetical protein
VSDTPTEPHRRIEDYRADVPPDAIADALARNTRSIAMQAYLHAFPAFLHLRQLTEFIQVRRCVAPDECPLGGWVLMRELATPATTTVSPNVDTLYGAGHVLLDRHGPVLLEVPPIPDRYYSVALLDASFDHFAVLSPRTVGSKGGTWAIVPPGWAGELPGSISLIEAPTPSVCLLQRIFIRSEAEYEVVRGYQDAITLVPLATLWRTGAAFPTDLDLSDLEVPGLRATTDPLAFFRWTNRYRGDNPPPASDAGLMALFDTVGVGPGSTLPEDEGMLRAIADGASDAQDLIDGLISSAPTRGGWQVPDPTTGIAGPHIARRAAVQISQMGALPAIEATYFFAFQDAEGLPLDGACRYEITFSAGQLPPVQELGFWSLTMYDRSSLLAENPAARYALRPDSSAFEFGEDGSLTLVLAAERPERTPDGNWLPMPDGRCNVALRTYLPEPAVVDGTWFPPPIVRAG